MAPICASLFEPTVQLENILVKPDGGVDLNAWQPEGNTDPAKRDNPPAVSTDVFLGYEQPTFKHRQGPEKFAAEDSARGNVGSSGAETWTTVIWPNELFVVQSGGDNATPANTAAFLACTNCLGRRPKYSAIQ